MKEEKGITIITLVITIIVLIILAGVSINALIGKDGIITEAKQAKENYELAQEEEKETLNSLYEQMVAELGSIESDSEDEETGTATESGTATAEQILEGYTAYQGGQLITGTMTNRGAIIKELSAGESYAIPKGYHNGNGVVTAKDLASQTQGTATADNLTEGKTAWVNGQLITGTGVDNEASFEEGKASADVLPMLYLKRNGNCYTSFSVTGKTHLVVTMNTADTLSEGVYTELDYIDFYDGNKVIDGTSLYRFTGKLATIDCSAYLEQCESGYITINLYASSSNYSNVYVSTIELY